MTNKEKKENDSLLQSWQKTVESVKSGKKHTAGESAQDRAKRIEKLRTDYNFFVQYYFSHYTIDDRTNKNIDCAPFHVEVANHVKKNGHLFGIIEWARGLAKSTHFDIFIPLWLKIQSTKQLNFMVLVGVTETASKQLLQGIQAELQFNDRFVSDFGLQMSFGSWEDKKFVTQDSTTFVGLGMGQSPRGLRQGKQRPDYIVCDDLDNEKLKKNPARVREYIEWIYRALIPTMDIGYQRFFFVNNNISKQGILSNLKKERPHWYHSGVPALDAKGECSWKAKYTKKYYAALKIEVGYKAFETEYQNNPIEDSGVFNYDFIVFKKVLEDWAEYDALVMYCDASYSTSPTSDFTAIKLWAKKGLKYICLKAYCRQNETIEKAIKWWYSFYYMLPENVRVKVKNYVEANQTQKYILKKAFTEVAEKAGVWMPINFDEQKKADKEDRIASMISNYENGLVEYNIDEEKDSDMRTSVEQLLSWSEDSRAHDDSPDADQGAWSKLPSKIKRVATKTVKFKQSSR